MNHPTHTNKTDSPQKQRMCVGNAETRCGRGVNGVLFTAVSKGAKRSGSDRLPPMLTKYQSGERSFRLYFLLVRFLCTSKENEQIKSFPNKFTFLRNLTNNQKDHPVLYWQHSDHLGSASWITDTNGTGIQSLLYMPFGEPLSDNRNTSYNSRYTFSGKERDTETGYSYFGARYYNSDLSIWLSVDPMADNTPSVTPYTYCINNPIKLIDPNVEDWFENEHTGDVCYQKNCSDATALEVANPNEWKRMGGNYMFGKSADDIITDHIGQADIRTMDGTSPDGT